MKKNTRNGRQVTQHLLTKVCPADLLALITSVYMAFKLLNRHQSSINCVNVNGSKLFLSASSLPDEGGVF